MAELKTFVFTDICRSVDLKNEMSGRSVTERDMAFIQKILIPHRERIEANLAETLGAAVSIEHGLKGGRVVIKYNGLDELEGILAHIK